MACFQDTTLPFSYTYSLFAMRRPGLLLLQLLACWPLLGLCTTSPQQPDRSKVPVPGSSSASSPSASSSFQRHEREYHALYEVTEEKDGLEAIKDLHRQLDDDNDGAIEPSETGDFIRGDLQYSGDRRRQKSFHDRDAEITVKDLWTTWRHSEVYNWTTEQVTDWLAKNVELPQYAEHFRLAGVNGTHLPKAAVSNQYLAKVVGVTNAIHRSKVALKAMDVVLFGPPRDHNHFWKDMILTSLLVLAVTGLFYAYRQNKRSQEHLQKMMHDLDGLSKAEETLQELQEKLQQKDSKIESLSSTPSDVPDAVEVSRLKEELEILRSELHRAEVELEDKCWVAPPVLQHWLQLTYELESVTYNAKKKAAEDQLELAKDMCDKLKKKRSSLVGAFVSTHGQSINDVDRSILDAKTALMELTKDLTERSQRWRQIEMLCGVSIVANPGVAVLQNLVRHVGAGRGLTGASGAAGRMGLGSRLSTSASQDDLHDDNADAHSVAASSSHFTAVSSIHRPSPASLLSSTLANQHQKKRIDLTPISRDSSKESSSSSDELAFTAETTPSEAKTASSVQARASTPPAPVGKSPASIKRSRMVKSISQDAGGSIQTAVASATVAVGRRHDDQHDGGGMSSSVSESQLPSQRPHPPIEATANSRTVGSSLSMLSSASSNRSNSGLTLSQLEEESCSEASESGSQTDLEAKKKKRRSFFNFRKKKEKKDLL